MLCNGHHVADVDVPRAGADLNRLRLADVYLRYEHVVGVRMLFDGENFARNDVFYVRGEVLGYLNLGAGYGHGLGEFSVAHLVQTEVDKFIEPFS